MTGLLNLVESNDFLPNAFFRNMSVSCFILRWFPNFRSLTQAVIDATSIVVTLFVSCHLELTSQLIAGVLLT